MIKTTILLTAVLLLIVAPASAQEECAVSLDHVDGLVGGAIPVSSDTITYWIRLTNNLVVKVKAMTNGFEISGSDPAVSWNVVEYDGHPWMSDFFDPWGMYPFSVDGTGADTIGYAGSVVVAIGMPALWDEVSLWIKLTVTDPQSAGHQLCLDSCYFPPWGDWMWYYGSAIGSFEPDWDGPHCYDIYSCCEGMRGNIDCDPTGEITVSDLVYLVSFMFSGGPAPLDMATADFGDDGSADITDLIYIVEYMFRDGPPPPACP